MTETTTKDKNKEEDMESLLGDVNLDSITIPEEQRKISAVKLIKLAYQEVEKNTAELLEERGSIASEQNHPFLGALWENIEKGIKILNSRSNKVKISAEKEGTCVTFTFSKKEEENQK